MACLFVAVALVAAHDAHATFRNATCGDALQCAYTYHDPTTSQVYTFDFRELCARTDYVTQDSAGRTYFANICGSTRHNCLPGASFCASPNCLPRHKQSRRRACADVCAAHFGTPAHTDRLRCRCYSSAVVEPASVRRGHPVLGTRTAVRPAYAVHQRAWRASLLHRRLPGALLLMVAPARPPVCVVVRVFATDVPAYCSIGRAALVPVPVLYTAGFERARRLPAPTRWQVMGTGPPQMSLIDPSNPSTGGVRLYHQGLPPSDSDPYRCPVDPTTGKQSARDVTFEMLCNKTVTGLAEPVQAIVGKDGNNCSVTIQFMTAFACNATVPPPPPPPPPAHPCFSNASCTYTYHDAAASKTYTYDFSSLCTDTDYVLHDKARHEYHANICGLTHNTCLPGEFNVESLRCVGPAPGLAS